MTDAGERTDDKRMRLRYAGHCRLCGTPLPAGTDAVYERSRRTVCCVECSPGLRSGEKQTPTVGQVPSPTSAELAAQLGTPTRSDSTAPLHTSPVGGASLQPDLTSHEPSFHLAPATAAPSDSLRLRAPASAVIAETLRIQALHPPRSRVARFFGRDPLSPDALPWFQGALGELEVGRVLDQLGEGWHAIHAIPIGDRGSDIDHLVIGPAGVFTINTKRHTGDVWVADRTLMVNGQRKQHLRNAEHESQRVAKILSVPVTPLVVIVGARKLQIKQHPEKVVVLRSGELTRWLKRSASVLQPTEVRDLAARAADPVTWRAAEPPRPDLAGFEALRAARASAERRRRAWGLGVSAAIVASALVALANLASISAFISSILLTVLP